MIASSTGLSPAARPKTAAVAPLGKPSAAAGGGASHLFVDNVRFWSMFAVVAIHAAQVFVEIGHRRPGLIGVLETPFKFATIAFFLMSGFLAGRGLETSHPWVYLKRRMQRIFLPWLFWISMMILGLLATDFAHHRASLALNSQFLALVEKRAVYCLFGTAFWFVPNLLLSLAILLVFRRVHKDLRFGAVLLSLSLLYALNIYTAWFPSRHTEALLGFVFYLWLGTYASQHQAALERWMAKVSFVMLFGVALLTGLLAYGEALHLARLGVEDPLNSLRFTNQLFSVAAVLFLFKFRVATWPRFVSVRDNTFGVYLVHPLALLLVWPVLKSHPLAAKVNHLAAGRVGGVLLWVAVTLVAYGLSLATTKLLARVAALRWLVGLTALGERTAVRPVVLAAEPDLSIETLAAPQR